MEKEIKKMNNCENCIFYSQYYVKQNTRFIPIFSGICKHKYGKYIKNAAISDCEYWEAAIRKEERQESLKSVLLELSKRLNGIAVVLEDDLQE